MPGEQEAMGDTERVRSWINGWRTWRGAGELVWVERLWRILGKQQLPATLILHSVSEVLAWLDEEARWTRASQRYAALVARWPRLAVRLERHFNVLADYDEADFTRLHAMVAWLEQNPATGLYARQVPLAGIDSKWLEPRIALIADWIAAIGAAEPSVGDSYAQCGLRRPVAQVRMRVLDPLLRQQIGGLADITAPIGDLAALKLPARVAVIVENLQTGLALGDIPGAIAFMGLGYGVDQLADIAWLKGLRLVYWGDIDTHGFAIVNRARTHFPDVITVLMDELTLHAFKDLWGKENQPHGALELPLLTFEESKVYLALKRNSWGQNVRLEQERIAWDYAWPLLLGAATM